MQKELIPYNANKWFHKGDFPQKSVRIYKTKGTFYNVNKQGIKDMHMFMYLYMRI